MAVIVVVVRDHLYLQVMLKAFSVVGAVIISGAVPFNLLAKKKTQFLNETIIMLTLYNMICFSPFVPDLEAKQKMGYFCCLVVASHLFLNLYLILSTSFYGLKVKAMVWLARRKLSKQRAGNQIKIQSRKHLRKLAMSKGLIEEEPIDLELRDQYQLQPQAHRKFQLEPIEEEEV